MPKSAETRATAAVRFESEGLVMLVVEPVVVALWRKKPVEETFLQQRRILEEVAKARPKETAFLCIVEEAAEPPEAQIRSASAKMIADLKNELSLITCVVEGSGFRAAITRTVLSGIRLLAQRTAPFNVFDDVDRAVAWIATRSGEMSLSEVSRAIEAVRRPN